jgi:ABC-type branched-subunit amino acid transport system ATPase component
MSALLSVHQASKAFGGVKALQDVDIDVPEGSITALIGPNGAGKTTLFNVITGFARPDSGTVLFAGTRIDRLAPWQIARRGLTRTFQTSTGFANLTVLENLLTAGSSGALESVWAALSRADLRAEQEELARRAEQLLRRIDLLRARDTILADLSAADTKLVELARQLMLQPRLLLLDEPASGFDPDRLQGLGNLVRDLCAEGVTVLVIEHNLSFVMSLAAHVHVLAGGSVISAGTPAQVMSDREVIRHYLGKGHEPAGRH